MFRHVCSNRSEYNGVHDLLPLREETCDPFANAHTEIRSLHQKLKARPIEDLRGREDSEDTRRSRTPKFPWIEDIVDLV